MTGIVDRTHETRGSEQGVYGGRSKKVKSLGKYATVFGADVQALQLCVEEF